MYDALMGTRCRAVIYDDTAIVGQLQKPDWRDYEMPLLSIMVEPWGMGVRPGEVRLEKRLSDQIREWHRSGRIAALEERWHIPTLPSPRTCTANTSRRSSRNLRESARPAPAPARYPVPLTTM